MITNSTVRWAVAVGTLVAAVLAAAVGVTLASGASHRPRSETVVSHGLELLPGKSLTDWVTYGDALVKATIESEVHLPVSNGDTERAYVPRGLVLSVDRVLWQRPSTGAQDVPPVLHFQLDGWDESHDRVRPIRPEGEPDMKVGNSYAVLLTHLVPSARVTAEQWAPTNLQAIVPLEQDAGNTVDPTAVGGSGANVRQSFSGKPLSALLMALAHSPVDPAAVPYMSLPPDERYQRAASK